MAPGAEVTAPDRQGFLDRARRRLARLPLVVRLIAYPFVLAGAAIAFWWATTPLLGELLTFGFDSRGGRLVTIGLFTVIGIGLTALMASTGTLAGLICAAIFAALVGGLVYWHRRIERQRPGPQPKNV